MEGSTCPVFLLRTALVRVARGRTKEGGTFRTTQNCGFETANGVGIRAEY